MTFSSADPSIAQIDETGLITGLSPGVTTVSAALGDTLSASCTIVVHGASSLRIPDGTRIIRDEAFLSAAAQEVVLPDSVTSIGVRAFADNKSLCLINIPPNLVKIDPSAFAGSTDVLLLCTEGSVSAARIAAMGLRHVLLPAQTE